MLPPTHLAAGFLIAHVTAPYFKKKTKKHHLLFVIICLFSILPDIDLLWAWDDHRFNALHFPSFWLILCLALVVFGRLTRLKWLTHLALAVFLGAISHLVLDSIGIFNGIYWLYPLINAKYSMLPITIVPPKDLIGLTRVYFSHPLYIWESLICAISIAVYVNAKRWPFSILSNLQAKR
jgi:hypothetical protein